MPKRRPLVLLPANQRDPGNPGKTNHVMSNPTSSEMDLRSALRYAKGQEWSREDWAEAEKVIVKAGLCPSCACHGLRQKLGPWTPGNQETWAGRECLGCGDFVIQGPQPEYDTGPECFSDADPGL